VIRSSISDGQWRQLLATRSAAPEAVAGAYAQRKRPASLLSQRGTLFLVAADHPARGALASGGNPMAMADRRSLLERLVTALAHPEVDGVLGSPDVIEELLLLGALDGKVVIGSMNRGGLPRSSARRRCPASFSVGWPDPIRRRRSAPGRAHCANPRSAGWS
jgi:hypothetical protein